MSNLTDFVGVNTNPDNVTEVEALAGTEVSNRSWSPFMVHKAIEGADVKDNVIASLVDKLDRVNGKSTGIYQTFVATSTNTDYDLDISSANVHSVTIDGATEFTISGLSTSSSSHVILILTMDGGLYSVTWPATVTWGTNGGLAPELTGKDVIIFRTTTDGTVWDGFYVGSIVA